MKRYFNNRSSTLFELLVSIAILSVLIIVFAIIDLFAQSHVITSDRRTKAQNELSFILEHSAKRIARVIGNPNVGGAPISVGIWATGDGAAIRFYIDAAADYESAGDGQAGTGGDHWEAYRYRSETAIPINERYQLWYCPRCTDSSCNNCDTPWGTSANTFSERITSVSYAYDSSTNYADLQMTACWDPQHAITTDACGTDKNPSVTMKTRVYIPAVSTR